MFFVEPLGAPRSEWLDGEYGGVATRYRLYELPGSSINYAWKGEYLIFTTNFPALKEILDKRLRID